MGRPTLDSTGAKLSDIAQTANAIVTWKRWRTTLAITLCLFVLSGLGGLVAFYDRKDFLRVTWLVCSGAACVTALSVCFVRAPFCRYCTRCSHAYSAVRAHRDKDFRGWQFFEEVTEP